MAKANTTRAVRVACRIRPFLSGIDPIPNVNQYLRSCVVPKDKNHIGFRFQDENTIQEQVFKLDNIYTEQSTQEEIFRNEVEPLLIDCFDGKNATLLCYGPTGSGKTYTCVGNPGDTGMIPRSIEFALRRKQEIIDESRKNNHKQNNNVNINNNKKNKEKDNSNSNNNNKNSINNNNSNSNVASECEIQLSCIEIYNEKVYDLLAKSKADLSKDLQILNAGSKGIVIRNATLVCIFVFGFFLSTKTKKFGILRNTKTLQLIVGQCIILYNTLHVYRYHCMIWKRFIDIIQEQLLIVKQHLHN